LYAVTLLAALGWALSNVRQIGPENRAVVLRLGALHRIQNAGLLLAWPRPLEQVLILPSPDRVLEHHVAALLRSAQALQAENSATKRNPLSDALAGSGYLLTGDAGVVQLDVRVFYSVVNPYDYVVQGDHITPALERLITRSAVTVCAARDLDTILVARPELVGAGSQAAEHRERLRGDLVRGINQELAALQTAGMGLGIHVVRVDVQASLPREAVSAFNAVLTASQTAEQSIAKARTEAAQLTQTATQAADRTVQVAHAQASERLARAQADTATVLRLAQAMRDNLDPGLLLRLYRERMAAILSRAGAVITVDPRDDARLIIPGGE
jgi:regulator of protease activity HflC (stomatin/prohibitin superfamily)